MKVTTFDPKKKKKVLAGHIDGDTFTREVKQKHYMHICQGYGIQEVVIEKLKELGIKNITIISEVSKLHSKLSEWLEPDIKVMNFNHGKQRFLPVNRMKREPKNG